jgi:enoyl-CoA hydratase
MSVSPQRRLATIHLERPRGNAINHDFLAAVGAALTEAESDEVAAVVITGRGRTFSSGLDLQESLDHDRAALGAFVDAFEGFFERVFTLSKPVVAAINGHAIAGGCILAMAADVRVMAAGDHRIGINEVEVGIPFPAVAFEIARAVVRPDAYADCFLEGRKVSPSEALALGLVHEVVAPEDLLARAAERARALASSSPAAFATIKGMLREPAIAAIRATREPRRRAFLDAWLSEEGRRRRTELVLRFSPKPAG